MVWMMIKRERWVARVRPGCMEQVRVEPSHIVRSGVASTCKTTWEVSLSRFIFSLW